MIGSNNRFQEVAPEEMQYNLRFTLYKNVFKCSLLVNETALCYISRIGKINTQSKQMK